MNRPKLSICIATYNRAACIGETLECLVRQLQESIEIVVLDGGSTDDTESIVGSYQRACPAIRYIRQQQNGGVDRDFDAAVASATGEFCWLMSDDDLIRAGALSAVMERLQESGISLLIVNAEVWNWNFSRILDPNRMGITEDRVYPPADLERMFLETGVYLSFIGCVVIHREVWIQRVREQYFGSYFIHMGVIFQQRLPGKAIALSETWIRIRYGNAMWKPKEFEVWMVRWPHLIWSFNCLSTAALASFCPPVSIRQLKKLFFFRANGTYSLVEYRQWIAPRHDPTWFRASAFLIALFPGIAANLATLFFFRFLSGPGSRSLNLVDARKSRFYFGNLWSSSRKGA